MNWILEYDKYSSSAGMLPFQKANTDSFLTIALILLNIVNGFEFSFSNCNLILITSRGEMQNLVTSPDSAPAASDLYGDICSSELMNDIAKNRKDMEVVGSW